MAKTWMENTASGPRVIGGKLCQPGEGNWVDNGPLAVQEARKVAHRLTVTPDQLAALTTYQGDGVTVYCGAIPYFWNGSAYASSVSGGGIPLALPDPRSSAARLLPSYSPAPTLAPVDYLSGVRIYDIGTTWLFGPSTSVARGVSTFARNTYAESTPVMSPTTTFPNVGGSDTIAEMKLLNDNTMIVEVGGDTTNNIIYKVTTTDGWATCAYVPWLYLGADNPTTGVGGNARGTVGYRLLSKFSVTVDSNGDTYVAEYNAANVAVLGVRMRVLKLAAGAAAWTVVWSLNVGAAEQQIRHIHCCQINPFTGALWIGTGDLDAWNQGLATSSTQNQSWIVVWNKTTPLPDSNVANTSALMVAALQANSGVKLLHGTQQTRAVQFLFRSDAVYYMSDAGTGSPESSQYTGIFKANHTGTTLERVYGLTADNQNASGYYAVLTPSGTMVFMAASINPSTFAPIITSRDGLDFALAGQIGKPLAQPANPFGAKYDSVSGNIFVSYAAISGKAAGSSTIVFKVLETTPHNKITYGGDKIVCEPEVLHPVYWVDPNNSTGAAADAAAPAGYSPRAPWLTFGYALSSSRMTHGASLKVIAGTTTVQTAAVATANWSANAISGDVSMPLEIDLRGCNFAWNTNAYWLTWTATQHLRLRGDNIKFGTTAAGGSGLFNNSGVTADSNFELLDSRAGYLDHVPGLTGGRIGLNGRGLYSITRSRVMGAAIGEVFQNSVASSGKSSYRFPDSVFDEITQLVLDNRTDSDYDYRYCFAQVRGRPFVLINASAATGAYRVKSCAIFTGATSGNILFHGTGKPAAFAQDPFRDCVVNYTWTTAIDAIPITNPEWFVTNTFTANSYYAIGYVPRDPASGDWRDERYPPAGPRLRILGDNWLSGAPV